MKAAPAARKGSPLAFLAALVVVGAVAAGYVFFGRDDAGRQAEHSSAAAPAGAMSPTPSLLDAGGPVAVQRAEVPVSPEPRAPSATSVAPVPSSPPQLGADEETLMIKTTPEGAAVYLDGSMKGRTPLALPATGDRHKLALVLPGRGLHRAEIVGTGVVSVNLSPAQAFKGPAGIKVRCRTRNRFHVTIDGKDTGLLCPTERISVSLGKHEVEVYDPVTDTTTQYPVEVKETHNSFRVRIDEVED